MNTDANEYKKQYAMAILQARYYWLLLAGSLLTRQLFGAMAQRIAALPGGDGVGGICRRNPTDEAGDAEGRAWKSVWCHYERR